MQVTSDPYCILYLYSAVIDMYPGMEEEEELETREAWQDSISEKGSETREEQLGTLAEQDTLGSSESEGEGEGEA
jgi:hypothetical protein